jgi:hypothetical protein
MRDEDIDSEQEVSEQAAEIATSRGLEPEEAERVKEVMDEQGLDEDDAVEVVEEEVG